MTNHPNRNQRRREQAAAEIRDARDRYLAGQPIRYEEIAGILLEYADTLLAALTRIPPRRNIVKTYTASEFRNAHALALKALAEPYRSKLTPEEIESVGALASLAAAHEPPVPHERAMCAQARAVLGISLSLIVPVWQR